MAKNGEKIQKYTIFCQKNQKSKKKNTVIWYR